jgi:hypothetical protein
MPLYYLDADKRIPVGLHLEPVGEWRRYTHKLAGRLWQESTRLSDVTIFTTVVGGTENEVIVFADKDLEENLINKLRASNLEVDARPPIGTTLRISAKNEPRRFFETVLEWWLDNRPKNVAVTMRMSNGEVFELKDSVISDVRKRIERLA